MRDVKGVLISSLVWNPTEGLHLLSSSDDEYRPVIKFWDLRSSTTSPLIELTGHDKGILSLSWCPHDTDYVLSCGKDNKIFLWDLQCGSILYEFPVVGNQSHADILSSLKGRR